MDYCKTTELVYIPFSIEERLKELQRKISISKSKGRKEFYEEEIEDLYDKLKAHKDTYKQVKTQEQKLRKRIDSNTIARESDKARSAELNELIKQDYNALSALLKDAIYEAKKRTEENVDAEKEAVKRMAEDEEEIRFLKQKEDLKKEQYYYAHKDRFVKYGDYDYKEKFDQSFKKWKQYHEKKLERLELLLDVFQPDSLLKEALGFSQNAIEPVEQLLDKMVEKENSEHSASEIDERYRKPPNVDVSNTSQIMLETASNELPPERSTGAAEIATSSNRTS